MNNKGHKPNLKASQPGNTNAEKSGVYSGRRKTEKARDVRKAMAEDPDWLLNETAAQLAEIVGLGELYAQDIAERGLTDRKGELRRVVGAYARNLKMRQELTDQIQANLASAAAEARNAEPLSEAELLRLLRDIAHAHSTAPGASVSAIKYLLEVLERAPSPEEDAAYQMCREIWEMSPETLETELIGLQIPITTGRGPEVQQVLRSDVMMRQMAMKRDTREDQLRALQRVLAEELGPLPSETPPLPGEDTRVPSPPEGAR